MKTFLPFHPAILLSLAALPFTPIRAQVSKTTEASVDSFVRVKMRELDIPGLALAVVQKGKVLKIAGYGSASLEWNQPVTAHTNFQIASCSKLLASTLVMKAVHLGKLRLSDGLDQFTDSLPATWKGIQVRHLLNHTSGIPYYNGDYYAPMSEVMHSLKDSSLKYAPGSAQSYYSFDYTVLRFVLEKVFEKPYEQILRDELTMPAGMNDGGFDSEVKRNQWLESAVIREKATTYFGTGAARAAYKFIYPVYTYAAGGYFASISDMAKWALALDRQVLFPATVEEKLAYASEEVGSKPSHFSEAGWTLEKENGIVYGGHSGGPGLGDVLRFPAQGYTFIVLSNDGELLPGLARALAGFYISGLPPAPPIQKFKR